VQRCTQVFLFAKMPRMTWVTTPDQGDLMTDLTTSRTTRKTALSDPGNRTLTVSTAPGINDSPGVVGLGFGPKLITSWVYAVDLCAALATLFGLSIIGEHGAPLGDENSWERRRNLTVDDNGTVTINPQNTSVSLRAVIAPPQVGVSRRGNPTVTPVNTRAELQLIIDGFPLFTDPAALLNILIDHQLVNRFDDWQQVFTRHLHDPLPAFEVWPNRRTTSLPVNAG
jgi:hypothetical protein